MSPGVLPFVLRPLLGQVTVAETIAIAVLLTVVFVLLLFRMSAMIQRSNERDMRASILGYAGPVLFSFLFFPAHAVVGFTVLVILAFGDGSATLGGLLIGGPRLPWNRKKSWAGVLCFTLVGGFFTALVFRQEIVGISWGAALSDAFSVAFPAAVIESARSRLNDNLRVGVVAGALSVLILIVG